MEATFYCSKSFRVKCCKVPHQTFMFTSVLFTSWNASSVGHVTPRKWPAYSMPLNGLISNRSQLFRDYSNRVHVYAPEKTFRSQQTWEIVIRTMFLTTPRDNCGVTWWVLEHVAVVEGIFLKFNWSWAQINNVNLDPLWYWVGRWSYRWLCFRGGVLLIVWCWVFFGFVSFSKICCTGKYEYWQKSSCRNSAHMLRFSCDTYVS